MSVTPPRAPGRVRAAEPATEPADLIQAGQCAQWLATYSLVNEVVTTSKVNPPGLPMNNS